MKYSDSTLYKHGRMNQAIADALVDPDTTLRDLAELCHSNGVGIDVRFFDIEPERTYRLTQWGIKEKE